MGSRANTIPGRKRGPEPTAENRHHEGVEDTQNRAGDARQRRQPEQLGSGELEADRRQLRHHHRPQDTRRRAGRDHRRVDARARRPLHWFSR